jgi:hypothetical protein
MDTVRVGGTHIVVLADLLAATVDPFVTVWAARSWWLDRRTGRWLDWRVRGWFDWWTGGWFDRRVRWGLDRWTRGWFDRWVRWGLDWRTRRWLDRWIRGRFDRGTTRGSVRILHVNRILLFEANVGPHVTFNAELLKTACRKVWHVINVPTLVGISVHVTRQAKLVLNGIIIEEFDKIGCIITVDIAANGVSTSVAGIELDGVIAIQLDFLTSVDVDEVACFQRIAHSQITGLSQDF